MSCKNQTRHIPVQNQHLNQYIKPTVVPERMNKSTNTSSANPSSVAAIAASTSKR